MILLTATTKREVPQYFLDSATTGPIDFDAYHNEPNIGLVMALHKLWEKHEGEDILAYVHDDVSIYDTNWAGWVRSEFVDPKVAIVGFGGATGIGVRDIYKLPYRIEQLIRLNYASNQEGWKIHGSHLEGAKDVAVVDGFFMAVRGSFLEEVGGWNWIESNFHCYDTGMCLEAIRRGWKVRAIGVSCTHHGGGTSTTTEYAEWCKEHATSMEEEHIQPHRWLYNEYRDLLPLRVP